MDEAQLERLVSEGTEELLARVGAAYGSAGGPWEERLRAVAYELRDFLREDPRRARAMLLEAPEGSGEARRAREWGVEALAALIDLGREEHPDPASVPPAAAELAAGVVHDRIHTAVEAGEPLGDEMVRELMFSAVLPFRGREAALRELRAPAPPGAGRP